MYLHLSIGGDPFPTAIYPGRFDPVTNGHLDVASRAVGLFGQVVVAVYVEAGNPLFSIEERVDLFRDAVEEAELEGVTVKPFSGLVVNFARQESASVMVRGIRAVTDFEAEFDMALMNKTIAPEIESVYVMASLDQLFVSGRRIREVATLGYDVSDLVPPNVARALRQKLPPDRH